jgi:hypothetical protein
VIAIAPLFVLGAAKLVVPFEPQGWKFSATSSPSHTSARALLLAVGVGLLVAA